jgi:hypothetical protein
MAEKLPQGRGLAARSTVCIKIPVNRRIEADQARFDQ